MGPGGTGTQAVLGGQRGQLSALGGELGSLLLGGEYHPVQQAAWSGQPPAVFHDSGFY